jgi:hypothetical protein
MKAKCQNPSKIEHLKDGGATLGSRLRIDEMA